MCVCGGGGTFCCAPKLYLLPGNPAVGPLHPTPIHAAVVDDVSVSTFLAGWILVSMHVLKCSQCQHMTYDPCTGRVGCRCR